MKRCPRCNDYARYDDDLMTCPICDATLVTCNTSSFASGGRTWTGSPGGQSNGQWRAGSTGGQRRATSSQYDTNGDDNVVRPRAPRTEQRQEHMPPRFMQSNGRRARFHGIVSDMDTRTTYPTRFRKITNTVLHGEPYQFGNTARETILRLDEIQDGRLSTERRDLTIFGDPSGMIAIGDDITATAVRHGDRYIIKSLYSNETRSSISMRGQLPGILYTTMIFAVMLLVISIIYGIITFITSGGLVSMFDAILAAVMSLIISFLPYIVLFFLVIFIIRKLLGR